MSPSAGKEPKVHELPPNFSFTRDDPFYFGPATCNLLHYTPAAYMAGFVEMAMLLGGSLWFWRELWAVFVKKSFSTAIFLLQKLKLPICA